MSKISSSFKKFEVWIKPNASSGEDFHSTSGFCISSKILEVWSVSIINKS